MESLVRKESERNIKVVTTAEISEILGFSDRRIRQLVDENALVRIGHGKFDLSASIQAYISYLVEKEKPTGEIDKTEEEALWTRARRQKAELELQIIKGEVHRAEDVKRVMNNMLIAFRSRVLAIPSKISPLLIAKTDINVIKLILKDAVYEALTELSEYNPHAFYAESKDKIYLDSDENDEDESEEIEDKYQNKKSTFSKKDKRIK